MVQMSTSNLGLLYTTSMCNERGQILGVLSVLVYITLYMIGTKPCDEYIKSNDIANPIKVLVQTAPKFAFC